MLLLLFSDLHCNTAAAKSLLNQSLSHKPDILIGAGDFANARRGLKSCLDILKSSPTPAILVPGNNESFDELTAAAADWPSATVLHASSITFRGVTFFGLGGGIPITPFGPWSYDFSEQDAAKLLAPLPRNAVLISHSPPKGCADRSSSGQSLGSTAVREAILAKRPRLIVCGHIHASSGRQEQLDGLPVINAGPAGILFTLPTR